MSHKKAIRSLSTIDLNPFINLKHVKTRIGRREQNCDIMSHKACPFKVNISQTLSAIKILLEQNQLLGEIYVLTL